jgi:hypothetical protein
MAFPPRQACEQLIYALPSTYPEIATSTLHLFSNSPTTCFVRGSIQLRNGLVLSVFEYLDFSNGELLNYHYTIFRGGERVAWYDPQPHPENRELAGTFPHHRHEPPDVKHNRRPAPGISFSAPNLPTLVMDCIALGADPVAPA